MALLLMMLLLTVCCVNCSQNLSFLFLTSSSSEFNTSGVISAVDLALKDVIQKSFFLDGYTLQYATAIDSKCNRDYSQQILREQITNTTVAVIGCGCSNATQAITDLPSELQFIPVISYSSLSTILSNSTLYPSLIRVVPSYSRLPNALAQFISHFGWKQILLITQQIAATKEEVKTALNNHNIIVEVYSEWNHPVNNSIFLSKKRIFVLDVVQSTAKSILCQAFLSRKYYPGHAWIVIDNFAESRWWVDQNIYTNCTNEQFEAVLNYSLVIGIHSSANDTLSLYGGYAYDAVWTLALALNETINTDTTLSVDSFHEISFNGVTGPVSFNEGERQDVLLYFTQLTIKQDDILHDNYVANFNYTSLQLTFINSSVNLWPLGIPSDGIPRKEIFTVHVGVFVFSVLLTVIGLTWTLICLLFVIIYRNSKVIHLTSPNLNYFLILGCAFSYMSMLFSTTPNTSKTAVEAICLTRTLLISVVGYDLCIEVTAVKMWRIYYIFVNPHPHKKIPKDGHLLIVVAIIFAVDLALAVLFLGLDEAFYAPILVESKARNINETTGEETVFYFWNCRDSIYYELFQAWAALEKFVLLSASLYFAFRIRKIDIKVLNEYKATSAIVYSTVVLVIAADIMLPILESRHLTAYSIIFDMFVFLLVTLFLSFTFVPKMVALWKDPKGENVFVHRPPDEIHPAQEAEKCRVSQSSSSGDPQKNSPAAIAQPSHHQISAV